MSTAQRVYATLSDVAKAHHQAAWERIERHVMSIETRKAATDLETRYALQHARKLYQAEMAKGLPSITCENNVMQAYKVTA